eukprot:9982660-Lingulodinium_polyedra.AAC.1
MVLAGRVSFVEALLARHPVPRLLLPTLGPGWRSGQPEPIPTTLLGYVKEVETIRPRSERAG